MLNSTVLDVAVGLIFTFLAVSLAVSSLVEAIASVLKWRSKTLLQGMKDLLNDPQLTGLALNIYNHALVDPRDAGRATSEGGLKNLPAYIDPKQFANALIDTAKLTEDSPEKIKSAIDANISDPQINKLLNGITDRTAGNLQRMQDEIAGWFDNCMDRVGGAYKRKTQAFSFVIAFVLAAGLNISAIVIGQTLWQQPLLTRTIAPSAGLTPIDAWQQLEKLGVPVGWTQERVSNLRSRNGIEMFLGWVLTAVAALFGAPFWFDALGQIIRLKGSGPSPEEKRTGAGAAA
jgi:hypothetical protein